MKKEAVPPRLVSWKEQAGLFLLGAFCVLYGGIPMVSGELGWRNYKGQPVTVHLVLAVGVVFIVIGLLNVFLWAPYRRRVYEEWRRDQHSKR